MPVRNPDFSQSSELPLFTKGLRFLPKLLHNLETLAKELEKVSNWRKNFLGEVGNAIGAKKYGSSSQYATFLTKNGIIVTLRLSNHNATVSGFDNSKKNNGISIVVSKRANKGIINNGAAHIVEYYYSDKKLNKAEGKPLAEIVRSIQQSLYSGEYKDTTGLAEREEVNANMIHEHRVYHGSGADFDAFDHSHIGEGEGAQHYGWGSYVTEVEGIGRSYANMKTNKITYKGKSWDELWNKGDTTPEWLAAQDVIAAMEGNLSFEEAVEQVKKDIEDRYNYYDGVVKQEGHTEYQPTVDSYKQMLEALDSFKEEDFEVNNNNILYTVDIPDNNGHNYLSTFETIKASDRRKIADAVRKLDGLPAKSIMYPKYDRGWNQLADMIERNSK